MREPSPQLLKESLPPVPYALSAGKTYLTASITKAEPDNWFRIPLWLAGKWYSDLRWTTSDTAEPAGTHFPRRTGYNGGPLWGVERDAKGNIWHRLHPPEYEHQLGPNNQTTNSVIDQEDLVASSDVSLCERIHRFRTRVDSSGIIIDTFQDDIVKTLTPAYDGTIVSIQVVQNLIRMVNCAEPIPLIKSTKGQKSFLPTPTQTFATASELTCWQITWTIWCLPICAGMNRPVAPPAVPENRPAAWIHEGGGKAKKRIRRGKSSL